MTRSNPLGLRDEDDDYSYAVLRGDVERLELRADTFEDELSDLTATVDGLSSTLADTYVTRANNLSDLANAATARTNLGLGTAAVQAATFFLQTANNLSDLANAATARTNLGLGSAATLAASTFLQAANNLADLADPATARTNLGLGTAAELNATDFLQAANNLSDVASAASARANIGLGTMATQNASAVAITGGSIAGLTSLGLNSAAKLKWDGSSSTALTVESTATTSVFWLGNDLTTSEARFYLARPTPAVGQFGLIANNFFGGSISYITAASNGGVQIYGTGDVNISASGSSGQVEISECNTISGASNGIAIGPLRSISVTDGFSSATGVSNASANMGRRTISVINGVITSLGSENPSTVANGTYVMARSGGGTWTFSVVNGIISSVS